MPEISRFYGVIIRMFMEPNAPHHRPHFHAYYQNDVAIYAVDSIEIIAGSFPIRQQRLVEAWAENTPRGVALRLGPFTNRTTTLTN